MSDHVIAKKKLIEVALPLDAINKASAHEKSVPRRGHPATFHLWWARRPLAAARAVIFAQMVDDPSANPDLFPTERAQEKERDRLLKIIEALVLWENTNNETVLEEAREEIWQSWRRACAENADHPRAKELFDRHVLPAFHDPFCGGGSLPLEAQRLGLEAHASDLNPVAVLITKAMIEIPPKFAGRPPVNPKALGRGKHGEARLMQQTWRGAQGLAEDVRYYGHWMRDEAERRIGHLYPKVHVTAEMVRERPDLEPYEGRDLTVIAWLWARTVKSPNPAFAHVDVPLVATFMLSTKKGKEAYVEPVVEGDSYRFTVKVGAPRDAEAAKSGTKLSRGANFRCLMSDTPIASDYIKSEGRAGRMGERMMAIVAEGDRGRVYLAPLPEHESAASDAKPGWKPESPLPDDPRNFWTVQYGLTTFADLFTARQLVALTTFCDLVTEARQQAQLDGAASGLPDDGVSLANGGVGRGRTRRRCRPIWRSLSASRPTGRTPSAVTSLLLKASGISSRDSRFRWCGTSLRPTRSQTPLGISLITSRGSLTQSQLSLRPRKVLHAKPTPRIDSHMMTRLSSLSILLTTTTSVTPIYRTSSTSGCGEAKDPRSRISSRRWLSRRMRR